MAPSAAARPVGFGVVIVGASVAAARTIQALRRNGYEGKVTAIGDEPTAFYNRPPLTKEFLSGTADVDDLFLLSPSDVQKYGVEVLTNIHADSLNLKAKTVSTSAGDIPYDTLVIATGMRARRLGMFDGAKNVYYLRTLGDAQRLRSAFSVAKKIIVLGFGFLGCEVASVARELGIDVTIVDSHVAPYSQFGHYFSDSLVGLHRSHGVRLELGAVPENCSITDAMVHEVILSNGARLHADLVVAAVGAVPNVEWLAGSGLRIDSGVVCSATLEAAPHVYAVGDIARWPHANNGYLMRIEHWTNAVDQAATVAHNIMQKQQKKHHNAVPYFWSTQYGRQVQYLGFLENYTDVAWFQADNSRIVGVFQKDKQISGIVGVDSANVVMRSRATVSSRMPWELALAEVSALANRYGYELA